MKRHHPLVHVGGICALAFTFFGCWWINSARRLTDAQANVATRIENAAITAIHEEADKTRTWAGVQIGDTRKDLLAAVNSARVDLLTRSERQIAAAVTVANDRLGQTLSIADGRSGEALASIAGIRSDLQPTFQNTASLTAHADEAAEILFRRDALPAQLLGVTAAAKVTLGETAQMMKVVRDSAPQIAQSVVGIGKSADKIAADVSTVTHDFAAPKTFWQKVKSWLEASGKIAARFI